METELPLASALMLLAQVSMLARCGARGPLDVPHRCSEEQRPHRDEDLACSSFRVDYVVFLMKSLNL